jgi:hypothetical protein
MKLLFETADFEQSSYSNEDLIYTCVVIYLAHWVLQGVFYILLTLIGGEIWRSHKNRDIISRLAVDTAAMFVCCILGYEAFVDLGGFSALTKGTAYDRVSSPPFSPSSFCSSSSIFITHLPNGYYYSKWDILSRRLVMLSFTKTVL